MSSSLNLPTEILAEIIARLPFNSLLRLRSVSKEWHSLIGSSAFIAQYNNNSGRLQHLLVCFDYPIEDDQNYVSILDDVTFPQHKTPLTLPLSVNMLKNSRIIGCCNGLVCLYVDYQKRRRAVLWNPSIRKTVSLLVPNVVDDILTVVGFGVCRETDDPKIVKITYTCASMEQRMTYIPHQVEVFALSTGVWRTRYSNLPRKSIQFGYFKEAVDGFMYWLATDGELVDGHSKYCNLIIAFDMTSEELSEVHLPDNLAHSRRFNLSMSKLMKSLIVLEYAVEANDEVCCVWMMRDSATKSFTKLYTINMGDYIDDVCCFRNTGEPILQVLVENIDADTDELAVYEPCSKHITNLGIKEVDATFLVYPYVESLHLLSVKGKPYVSKRRGKKRRSFK